MPFILLNLFFLLYFDYLQLTAFYSFVLCITWYLYHKLHIKYFSLYQKVRETTNKNNQTKAATTPAKKARHLEWMINSQRWLGKDSWKYQNYLFFKSIKWVQIMCKSKIKQQQKYHKTTQNYYASQDPSGAMGTHRTCVIARRRCSHARMAGWLADR